MPMLAPRHAILTLGALIASGCGGEVAASGGNWEDRIGGMQARARYLVLVVDDSPDEDAAKLRAQIVRSLKSGLLPEINFLRMEYNDPASWHPIDQRVLVARPSAPDEVALVTPVSVPALMWKSTAANEAEIEPVVAAASDVLEASVAEATQAFRPLRAAKRALDLLFGARASETPEEAALLADPMRWPVAYVVIATARPTQDQGALADYELQPIPERDGMQTVHVITPWVGGATCTQTELAPGDWSDPLTIENWAAASNSRAYPWPCSNAEGIFRDLFADGHADMGPFCPAARFARLASGKTACRITIDQPDLERCDPERGWQERRPTVTKRARRGQ